MNFTRKRKGLLALTAVVAFTGFGVVAGVLSTPQSAHALDESLYSEWFTVPDTNSALEYRWGTSKAGSVAVIQFKGPPGKIYRVLIHRSEGHVQQTDRHSTVVLSDTGKWDTTSWYDTVDSIELDSE